MGCFAYLPFDFRPSRLVISSSRLTYTGFRKPYIRHCYLYMALLGSEVVRRVILSKYRFENFFLDPDLKQRIGRRCKTARGNFRDCIGCNLVGPT